MKVEKVRYQINWKAFRKGCSFFIPCLDPPRCRPIILGETKQLKYKVVTKVVIDDGVRGIRVWRV
jgi:hypothetical protein